MKKIYLSLIILASVISACKKEDLPYTSIKFHLHGYFNAPWNGISLDPNMPSLCRGTPGTQSKIRIIGYGERLPEKRNPEPGVWVLSQPKVTGYTEVWYHGESNQMVSCKDFDIKVIEKKYDPNANGGAGAFYEAGEIADVDDDCKITLNTNIHPRAIIIRVSSKLKSEQLFPGLIGLPIQDNKTSTGSLSIDCGPS